MADGSKWPQFLRWLAVVILQIIMTQVVTFLVSLLFPNIGDMQQNKPALFLLFLGICYTIGIVLIGWLGLKLRLTFLEPKLPFRLLGTLIGVFVPLLLALWISRPLEPGNAFYFMSIFTGILGFFGPEWIKWGK